MIEQIDDNRILKNVTHIISDFLAKNLPKHEPERFLTPHLPVRVQKDITSPEDLKRSDLYCNLRVLIFNDRYFRDIDLFSDNTINGCARIALAYRNRIAHQSYNEIVSLEHLQLEYIAINRLISLLPTVPALQPIIEDTRVYIGSILVFLAKEYFNTEIASAEKVVIKLTNSDQNLFTEYEEREMTSRDVKLSISEAKQQLRSLRSIINSEVADLPKWSNILRESILDQIIEHKIKSIENFRAALDRKSYDKTDERQFQYFEKIADIVKRL